MTASHSQYFIVTGSISRTVIHSNSLQFIVMNRIQDLSRGWSRLIFLPAGLVGGYISAIDSAVQRDYESSSHLSPHNGGYLGFQAGFAAAPNDRFWLRERSMNRESECKKARKPSHIKGLRAFELWCRWPDSNRHAIAGGGFWVFQFTSFWTVFCYSVLLSIPDFTLFYKA